MDTGLVACPETLPSFEEVVEAVRAGQPEGLDQLYRVFCVLSGSLRRQIGFQDFEDRMHDIFLMVVDAIRVGRLREPGALPSYIHGIARLSTCSSIGLRVRRQRLAAPLRQWVEIRSDHFSPEAQLEHKQRVRIMRELLGTLSERDREVLTRFYLHEQTKDQICGEMGLSETQFRLIKSRAKQRLERIGPSHINRTNSDTEAA